MPGRQEEDTFSSDSDNAIEFLCQYQSKTDENVALTKEEEEGILEKLNLQKTAVKSVTVRRVVGPRRSKAGTATCSVLSAGGKLKEYRSLPANLVIPKRYKIKKKIFEKALTDPRAKDPEDDQSVKAVDFPASDSVSLGDTNPVSQKVPIVNRFSDVILLSSDSESADDAKGETSNERGLNANNIHEQVKLPTISRPLDILLLSDESIETDTEDINQKKALTDASAAITKSLDILSLSDFDSDINENRSEGTSSFLVKESRVEVGSTICQVSSSVPPLSRLAAVDQNEKSFQQHVHLTRTEEWLSKPQFLSNFGLVPTDEYPGLLKSLEEASLQKRLKKNLRPRKTKIVKS